MIDITKGRQLFVDDFLIEETDLKRTYHTAEKYSGNPVFKAETETELEDAVCYLGHGGVFYDPADKFYKMWYSAGVLDGALAFATSKDAFHWTRPALGLPAGGNLILPEGGRTRGAHAGGDNCVWLDTLTDNPAHRIKFLTDRLSGRHLFVNVNCPDGKLSAEILDQNGMVVPGFSFEDCSSVRSDSTLAALTWKDMDSLDSLKDTPVQFRFRLERGHLYAFWVGRDTTGRSDGYVAGGGPGYTGATDTVGRAALGAGTGPSHSSENHTSTRYVQYALSRTPTGRQHDD